MILQLKQIILINLNISATPAFYINGKAISGYNERLILKALDDIK